MQCCLLPKVSYNTTLIKKNVYMAPAIFINIFYFIFLILEYFFFMIDGNVLFINFIFFHSYLFKNTKILKV
jgi:hypothetical protein